MNDTLFFSEPWLPPEYAETVREQVLSGWIGPAGETDRFTESIRQRAGAAYCLSTVSGTMALSVAAIALGLKAGDEILVPAYGVAATINAFSSFGLKPRLMDIDARTGCMKPDVLAQSITLDTRAVCFVDFSGYTGENLVQVEEICAERNLPLIEDAACAMGHSHKNRAAGTFGDVGVYSFSVPKIITTGQGGALLTKNRGLYENALRFIDHGDLNWRETNLHRGIGSNLRLNDLSTSLGSAQLEVLDALIERKRAVFNVLREMLADRIFSVPGDYAPLHNIVFTPEPDRLVAKLRDQNIMATRQYRTLSQHPAYTALAVRTFPNADFWTDHAVYLPFGLSLTPEDAQRIGDAVIGSGITVEEVAGLPG